MIKIVDINKSFGTNNVLRGVDLEIETGQTIAIIGRSGCGKSVLLKLIVGLLKPDSGYIEIDGKRINLINEQELYEVRRRFGFLFQGAALFDSMTVEENIGLPIVENGNKLSPDKLRNKITEMLELVDLPGIEKKKPAELSGGMKKRVGLARALITKPDFVLFDEPTTGLDPISSDNIDLLIKKISTTLNTTSIVVTHDMFTVKDVVDKVAMLHNGKIYFEGTPEDLTKSNDAVIKNFINRTE